MISTKPKAYYHNGKLCILCQPDEVEAIQKLLIDRQCGFGADIRKGPEVSEIPILSETETVDSLDSLLAALD